MKLSTCQQFLNNLNLSNKKVLVVGGTNGIGLGIAQKFVELKANVSIAGRNQTAGQDFINNSKKINFEGIFEFLPVEGTSIKDCHRLGQELNQKWAKLDYLIITMGLARMGNNRNETEEGFDDKMAIHYYSRVALINAILPLLKKTPQSRVLNVLAAGKGSLIDKEDLELKKNYSLYNCSQHPVMFSDLLVETLSKENPEIPFTHAYPGVIKTNLARNLPWYVKYPANLFSIFLRSPNDCAIYLLSGFLNNERSKGFYLMNEYGELIKPLKDHNEENRLLIWNHTKEILNKTLQGSK